MFLMYDLNETHLQTVKVFVLDPCKRFYIGPGIPETFTDFQKSQCFFEQVLSHLNENN